MEEPIFDPVSKQAKMRRQAVKNSVQGLISEFDGVVTDQKGAEEFLENLRKSWWSKPGPQGENFKVGYDDWNTVVAHVKERFPGIVPPDWDQSRARSLLQEKRDPQGNLFDSEFGR